MSSIQQNRFYNDPALGTAFSNLAAAFAPPSGSDLAGYAVASAKKAEAERLGWLFSNPSDPTASARSALIGVQNYGATPAGFAATDATNRRGQDISAATSRFNNAADNERAIATNGADNARAFAAARYGPISKDAVLPALPGSVADLYGVPQSGPVQGNISVGQGETVVTPDNRTIVGQPKPMTEEQVKAQERQRLSASGLLTDDMLRNLVLGERAPVKVLDDNGNERWASAGEAARTGAPAPSSPERALIEGTASVGGRTVQVFRKPSDSQYFTADGTAVPPNVQVFDKARPIGTNDQIGMKGTEFSDRNAIFYNRAAPASANIDEAIGKGYVPGATDFELMLGKAGNVLPISMSNSMVSDEGRRFYNNAMNFMLSVLRPDTGAAFGREEFQNYARVFIPLPGDDAQTIAEKAAARNTALAALQGTSRGAADQITRLMAANGLDIPPEMANRMRENQQLNSQGTNPAPTAAAPKSNYAEGTIIGNKATGQQMILQNGKWVPYGG
ncbi:hypothetical protein [Oryzifoliimicrobium ureilyticus]|uniref:hypothetical protein n=1 Tax=Oryzifoliimicrobium ureilyticus TaxID=3113724 RepID=UPI0030766A0A